MFDHMCKSAVLSGSPLAFKIDNVGPSSELAISRKSLPFPHLHLQKILDEQVAKRTLNWLTTTDSWHHHRGSFYDHESFSLTPSVIPIGISAITSSNLLAQMRRLLASTLESSLGPFAWVEAHRARGRDYIGIHTDGCLNEVRFILNLNRGLSKGSGVFTLQDHSDLPNIRTDYDSLHNSGIAFRTTPQSYHQVSSVEGEPRYSLLYRFPISQTNLIPAIHREYRSSEYTSQAIIITKRAEEHRWPAVSR